LRGFPSLGGKVRTVSVLSGASLSSAAIGCTIAMVHAKTAMNGWFLIHHLDQKQALRGNFLPIILRVDRVRFDPAGMTSSTGWVTIDSA
jgi:hypothetical protein